MLGRRFHVLRVIVPGEDAAVDLWMERFQPAFHHFGEAGVLGDVADADALLLQVLPRAAGAIDFDPRRGQPSRQSPPAPTYRSRSPAHVECEATP